MTANNKGDSGEDQMTPDTDDSGAHSEGFKRTPPPVMGQRGKKARTYPPKEQPNTHKVHQTLTCSKLSYVSLLLFMILIFVNESTMPTWVSRGETINLRSSPDL